MFLNGYRNNHSPLNVIVSCGLNNIPRHSDEQTIVQLECFAKSIHSLNKENKVIFATIPYAPKFCHSMRCASSKMITKTKNINDWIIAFNNNEGEYSLDLSSFGLKNNIQNNGNMIYKFEDWKEVETLKKLHFSDKVKCKVAVNFTKLCNTLDEIFKLEDEEKLKEIDLQSQTEPLIEKSSLCQTSEVNLANLAIPYQVLYPSRVNQNKVTDICVKCKWIHCRCENTEHEFSFDMTSEIFPTEMELPPQIKSLQEKTHIVKSEVVAIETGMRTFSNEIVVEDSSSEELTMVEKKLPNMIDNVELLEKQSKELKITAPQNILDYIMQNAKQHCKRCFIDHTPLPRWCSKYMENNKTKGKCQQLPTSKIRSSETSSIQRLCGGGRPKVIKPPKIRVLSPENRRINVLGTIFRSFNKYWFLYDHHEKCPFIEGVCCEFCSIRSISQRLNERKREPFIQPHEIQNVEEDVHLDDLLGNCIIKMSERFNEFSINQALHLICEKCGQTHKTEKGPLVIIDVDNEKGDLCTEIENYINRAEICCKKEDQKGEIHEDQMFIFIMLQKSKKVDVQSRYKIKDKEYLYLSHVQESKINGEIVYKTHFNYNELMLHQNECEVVLSDHEEMENNVKLIVLARKVHFLDSKIEPYNDKSGIGKNKRKQAREQYEKSDHGKKIRKQYETSDHGKHIRKQYEESDHGQNTRKQYEESDHGQHTRKQYHESDYGKKIRHMYAISKKRFESKSRYVESYHGKQTIKQYEGSTKGKQTRINFESRRILNNYESDTGFNIICCSCNEYKSQQSCVNILLRGEKGNRFTEEEEKEYLIKDPNLNISLDGHYYVCKTCLNQIKNKKKPKRNDCDVLQYYDFPQHLFDEVKEKCNKERELQSEVLLNSNLRISKSSVDEYRLNKLEQFIFKNPIPFVRIANCKMGRYLKVQGNLILMSSDIEHSMSKILPCDQKIIPVSLKRKLSYKGYYIEEWVDVDKIEVYFNWLKRNNPFFQDFQLNKEKIIMHEENLIEGVEEYLNTNQNMIDDEIDKDNISVESAEEYEALCGEQIGKLIEIKDEINVQHYDSILCNKYEHELHEESVSKRYADIINEYEIMQNIDNNFVDDFTQEDQYMYEKDEENITESPTKPAEISEEVKPFNVEQVNKKAKNRIKNVKKKIEKINIAPGEQGNFVKWGEDVFLEERCFPHLFPYGVGGYMSTALDGKNPNMGFTNYVRHRLLHVDSRFRNDTVYVFFLLLVKELVELRRSEETYLRQARWMPDLNITRLKPIL